MEWNPESVLDALNDFERKPEINPILDEYLQRIAKNGEIIFPWGKLKPLLKKKLEVVLDEFYETCPVETSVPVPNFETFNFDNLKKSILQAVDAFTSAPFTIQRLCELVTNPQKHYNRTDKYMRGIEKNVLVVSTIEPRTVGQGDVNNANNNVIVNGMINDSPREENDALNGHESESSDSVSSSNADTPSNHVLLENFANVFPSAACIPTASNICIKREIDTNFISTTEECVEAQEEVDFEATTTEHSSEEVKPKEEPMDTSEEESVATEDNKMSTEEANESPTIPETESEGVPEKKQKLEDEQSSDENVSDSPIEEVNNDINEDAENDISCAEISEEAPVIPEEAPALPDEVTNAEEPCQQDDTVSQSDLSPSECDDKSETKNDMIACDSEVSVSDNSNEESDVKTENEV